MKPQVDPSKLRRILITRADRLGDVVLSTPVFRAVKARYPNAFLAAMVFKETAPVLQGNPWIDEVMVYDKKGRHRSWWQTALFGFWLRTKHFDAVVHLHPTNRMNIISWLAGIPNRIGYRRKNHVLLSHVVEEKKHKGTRHEAEYNFDLLELIDVRQPDQLELYFPLQEPDAEALKEIAPELGRIPYAVFHPSASSISKIWPPERMAEVADELFLRYRFLPVIVGEGNGVDHALRMKQKTKQKAVDLAGRLNLGMLGWLMKRAKIVISNDSGPVHVACAVGTPVISIFGRNQAGLSPVRWGPIGRHGSYLQKDVGCKMCLADQCDIDFKCLKALQVSDVLDEVKKYERFFLTEDVKSELK